MASSIVLHPHSQRQIASLLQRKPHAIMITAPKGSGKAFTAHHTARLLGVPESGIVTVSNANTETNSIGIDLTRQLQSIYRLKNRHDETRVVIIEDAELMTTEAQNSILKLLEEPPERTIFIVTVAHADHVLPTIRSRCSQVALYPPTHKQLIQYASRHSDDDSHATMLLVAADGAIGELHELISNDEYRQSRLDSLRQAKALIVCSPFERFIVVHKHSKKKPEALQLLADVSLVIRLSFSKASNNPEQLTALVDTGRNVVACHDAIVRNGQLKLQLDRLLVAWR